MMTSLCLQKDKLTQRKRSVCSLNLLIQQRKRRLAPKSCCIPGSLLCLVYIITRKILNKQSALQLPSTKITSAFMQICLGEIRDTAEVEMVTNHSFQINSRI